MEVHLHLRWCGGQALNLNPIPTITSLFQEVEGTPLLFQTQP